MLQAAVAMGFGVRMEHIAPPTQTTFHLFGLDGVVVALQRLYVIIGAVVVLGALWMFLRRTRFGWALRACAQDPEAAALQGISITHTARLAMCIAAGMAGVAGALAAPLVRTYPYMGHSVIVTAFIVTIVGGLGSLEGAVVAAILYGFVHTFVTTFSEWCRRRHRGSAADAGGAHRATDGTARGPRSGLKRGDVERAQYDPPLEILDGARGGLRNPCGAAPSAQLLAEGDRGLSRHQRAGGGELSAADPDR